jgi:hypothetical protein
MYPLDPQGSLVEEHDHLLTQVKGRDTSTKPNTNMSGTYNTTKVARKGYQQSALCPRSFEVAMPTFVMATHTRGWYPGHLFVHIADDGSSQGAAASPATP